MLSGKSCSKEYPQKWSEAALAWFYLPLENLKIREKMLSVKSCALEESRAKDHTDSSHF
jgi:hypothetical protein